MFNILNIIEICNRKEPDRDDYIKCADWKRQPCANRMNAPPSLDDPTVVIELKLILQSVGKAPEQQSSIRHPAV